MPGMYPAGEYDLAGFCVGVVEKERILDGKSIQPGDAILGLASSGPHSNGYSLIRKILERGEPDTGRSTRCSSRRASTSNRCSSCWKASRSRASPTSPAAA